MNAEPRTEAIEEPRLIPPGQADHDAQADGGLRAGTAGPLGREYLRSAIARLRIEMPQRVAEPDLEAEPELEAGG